MEINFTEVRPKIIFSVLPLTENENCNFQFYILIIAYNFDYFVEKLNMNFKVFVKYAKEILCIYFCKLFALITKHAALSIGYVFNGCCRMIIRIPVKSLVTLITSIITRIRILMH